MKKLLLTMLLLAVTVISFGQERKVEGILIDRDTKEALPMTTVQILKTDSTFVVGGVTNDDGLFVIQVPENGPYLLRISSVGYVTTIKRIEIQDDVNLNMGRVQLGSDAIMLQGVTATAQALKVTMQEDTFVYNSAAYRTPEGSAVEELIKLLPGAKVDDSGNITINGKQVTKIKVDGKEFMPGDTQTALKNLPASVIERIKAYEEDSDRKRMTGIDDGDPDMTLDFGMKKGMNKGTLGNVDLGYGTHDRYAERIMGMTFKGDFRAGIFTNFNNTNNMGFGGRGGGMGRGRNGLNTANMVGTNFNYEKTGLLKLDGSVRWNHGTSDSWTRSSSESFVIGRQNFSNSLSQSYSKNKSWNANMRIEWTPNKKTTIQFRPQFSWSDNDSRSGSINRTFDSDPFLTFTSDPLEVSDDELFASGITRNSNTNSGLSYSRTARWNGRLIANHRLSEKGRNISLNVNGSFSETQSKNFSTQNMFFFNGTTDDYSKNRYRRTPQKNWDLSTELGYSEPIADRTYLQFTYKFTRSYSKSDQKTYDYSDITQLSDDLQNLYASLGYSNIPGYRLWERYLPADLGEADPNLSRFSEYSTYTHDIEMQYRRVRDSYNFNVGVLAQPQHTTLVQRYMGKDAKVGRDVFNITPTADFRYNFSKQHQLRFRYRGSTAQPNVSEMIAITDDSDPMNIRVGNPELKPSFTNRFFLNYNNFLQSHFQSISADAQFSTTRNSTANASYYNPETGGRISKTENVNGNWNAQLNTRYAIAIDTLALWNFSTDLSYRFSNNVGLATTSQALSLADMQRNITKSHNYEARIALSYRNNWLYVEPDGNVAYTNSNNNLRPDATLNTWQFSYGGNMRIDLPWGMSFSTDVHNRSRRGYNDASLNTNELIWNAQIAQSFLRGKPLSVALEFYDILKNQSSFSRAISAESRRDTEYNAINSYAMLHIVYRFQTLGGKKALEQMGPPPGNRPDFSRPEMNPQNRGQQGGQGQRPQGPPPGMGRPF